MHDTDAYTGRAEDYAVHRPAYARDAITALVDLTGLDSSWVVADVGSGTGNLSRHLVGLAQRVIAIEPNDEMRRHAALALGSCSGFTTIRATAEETTLPDQCVDLITAGQALHWFDPLPARREFARVLKPPGRIAVIWNQFDGSERPEITDFLEPSGTKCRSFAVTIMEPWESFIGGARSAAHAPLVGDPEYAGFEAAHRRAFEARAVEGRIEVHYTTEVAIGHLVS